MDQLTIIIIYVLPNGDIKKIFLGFMPIEEHIFRENNFNFLSRLGAEIKQCKGQSCDNAMNTSGKYSGLQALIKKYNPSAVFIPCASHSLK